MLGDLGTFDQSLKHHSGHRQGTLFPAPTWSLKPKTTVSSKLTPALRRLAPALFLHPSPWYQAHTGGE